MGIRYINLKEMDTLEIKEIKEKTERIYKKIERNFKNSTLVVDVNKMQKAGNRHKYSVHLRLEGGTSLVLTAEQADWDLTRALQETISNLQRQVDHKYHTEGTKHKKRKF